MKVRLIDIAQLANVSTTTVSIVLNNPDTKRISQSKREEILALAKKLNYSPNINAKSLKTKKTNSVGLIISDLMNPFFSELAKSLELILRDEGYLLTIVNTDENYKNDIQAMQYLYHRNVDALIIALSNNVYHNESIVVDVLKSIPIPYVLVDRVIDNFDSQQVIFNNKKGGYLATKHLIDNGHSKIAHISVSERSLTGSYRHDGYKEALIESEIEYDPKYVYDGSFDFDTGYRAFSHLPIKEITAVFGANDLICYGFIKKCKEEGVLIPGDISVVGYDDLKYNDMFELGLTSVNQDIDLLAKETVKKCMESLKKNTVKNRKTLVPKLKKRSSVRKIKKDN